MKIDEFNSQGITFNDLHNGYMRDAVDAVRIVHYVGVSTALNMAESLNKLSLEALKRSEWLKARALNVQRSTERRERYNQAMAQAKNEAEGARRYFALMPSNSQIVRRAQQIMKEREAVDQQFAEKQ